ncbi:hypothetical protein ACFL1Y_01825 [Patescibacteria group bacterium]
MSRRELKNKNIRKLFKKGGSYCVSLPMEVIKELKWKDNQKLVAKKKGQGISIVDWK